MLIEPDNGRPPLRIGLHNGITLGGQKFPGGHLFPKFDGDDKAREEMLSNDPTKIVLMSMGFLTARKTRCTTTGLMLPFLPMKKITSFSGQTAIRLFPIS